MLLRRSFFAALLLILAGPLAATELAGQVVAIADGDTLTLLTAERRQVRIRLAGIDTPESRQPYGTRARQELAGLAFRQQVRIEVQDVDRYGRTVGTVFVGRSNINAEMVRRGAAWVYGRYNKDPALPRLEVAARQARAGLWALPPAERVPPWEWRRPRR
ncbi:thermonuclease family protein [Roseomonas sp. USHLN139]|uniref:thermonuclease family protein n=1 Tax=Roseomonas sp. USHLN139 TaxID=3081298 RepID=UPI003B029520